MSDTTTTKLGFYARYLVHSVKAIGWTWPKVVRCECGRWRDAHMPRWDEDKIARAYGWVADDDCPGCGRGPHAPVGGQEQSNR